MKQMLGLLGWLGVALVAAAFILRFTAYNDQNLVRGLALAGLVVTLLYALSQWRDIQRSFQGKGARYGSLALGSILAFVGILVAINYISNRQNKRWDLTESKTFSLSDQTKQIVSNLKSDLHIKVFYSPPDTPQRYRDSLENYQYLSSRVTVDYIDGVARPTESDKEEIAAYPTLVLEYEGRKQRATSADEQAITNALKKIIEGKTKKAYFLQGHGERDPDDATTRPGYKGISLALVDENFTTAKLPLAQQGSIPADATVVIIAGATNDLLPQEMELIRAYLKNGGKLLIMVDPPEKGGPTQPTSLIGLAKDWGITIADDIVVDASGMGRLVGTDASVPIGMPTDHPITANFRVMTAFPLARSVTPTEGGADGKIARTIIQTSEQSWGEVDVKGLYATGSPKQDLAKGDKKGPISIAVAVSAPAEASATPATDGSGQKPESRLVVFGDSDFASNGWAGGQLGNRDLFLNTVNWLAQQEDLIAIRPRDPEDRRVTLTEDQQTLINVAALALIPLLLFGNAFRMYWKRR